MIPKGIRIFQKFNIFSCQKLISKMSTASEKLVKIRNLISQSQIDAYLVPHSDPHLDEYLPPCDERVKFISGFSGSNALCFISQKDAFMWTDGRYFIQAEEELEAGWKMMKMGVSETPWNEFIKQNYPSGTKIGYNPVLVAADVAERRKKFFTDNKMELVSMDKDLVEEIWTDRPKEPEVPIYIHTLDFAGEETISKFKRVAEKCADKQIKYYLTATLDEIAWFLNIRGGDIPCTPVSIANLLLDLSDPSKAAGTLFINKKKVTPEVEKYLNDNGFQVQEYNTTVETLSGLNGKVGLWKTEINSKLVCAVKEDQLVDMQSPIYHLKGVKNEREIRGMKESNIRDCTALAAFFAFLQNELVVKKRTDLSEVEAADKVTLLRSQIKYYKDISFDVIAAVGGNAAMAHYQPHPGKCSNLTLDKVFLLDSGAQYFDGTTDITRTVHFGTPTAEEKDAYTRVLLGNLDLEQVVWPKDNKICGWDLDVLARRRLWQNGMNYSHGTGHGIGYMLCVHEMPYYIGRRAGDPFVPGVVVSNEPGYYVEDKFGIRIENDLVVQNHETLQNSYKFHNMTMFPYDKNLIDMSLLVQHEIDFINNFHQEVNKTLTPLLKEYGWDYALDWLNNATSPL